MNLKKLLTSVLLVTLLAGCVAVPGMAEVNKSVNPLVDAQELVKTHVDDDVLNVLLLGNEHGFAGYTPSAGGAKEAKGIGLLAYHTDTVMVLSVNQTQGKINLVSIPRDTLAYVPGVYGAYKLNAAFNCATTIKEGIRHASDTVSRLLGGVKIDAYVFVDMGALVKLGDAMGGIDFDMDMAYTGHSGRTYSAGMQHLDGQGMMDYVRARKNATIESGSDQGRTTRNRQMVTAIIKKLMGNWDLINALWQTANSNDVNFYTDIEVSELATLFKTVQNLNNMEIGSYVLQGRYDYATTCGDFQFAITDQENRQQVLKEAFGIDAQPLKYASLAYIDWLFSNGVDVTEGETNLKNRYANDGFDYVKLLHRGQQVLNFCYANINPNGEQKTALEDFELIYNDYLAAFEAAADKADAGDRKASISGALKKNYVSTMTKLANQFGYDGSLAGTHGHYWEQDSSINQYSDIDWR